jgi:hypothetical protein
MGSSREYVEKPSRVGFPRTNPCAHGVLWLCGIFVANTADMAGFTGFAVS